MVNDRSLKKIRDIEWQEYSTYLFTKLGLDRDNAPSYKSIFQRVKIYFTGKDYTETTFLQFMEYLELDLKLSHSTINNHLKFLKHFAKYLQIKEDFTSTHPYKKKIVPYIEVLTNDELKKLIDECYCIHYRTGVMAEILAKTAIRNGELINIRWDDFKTDRIILRKTKTDVIRTVYIPPDLSLKILKLKHYTHGYMLGGHVGKLNRDTVNKFLQRAAKSARITKYVHAHLLRHTAGTQAAENTENPFKVKEFMGHSSLESTMRYVHMTIKNVQEVSESLPINAQSVTFEMVRQKIKNTLNKFQYPVCTVSYDEEPDKITFSIQKN